MADQCSTFEPIWREKGCREIRTDEELVIRHANDHHLDSAIRSEREASVRVKNAIFSNEELTITIRFTRSNRFAHHFFNLHEESSA